MKKIFIIIALSTIIGATWLLSRNVSMQISPQPPAGITKKITIWIHGTRGAALFPVGLSSKISLVEKQICTSPLGLHHTNEIDPQFHIVTLARTLATAAPEQFPLKDFYSFGWSGELDPVARKKAAQQLHDELKQLMLGYVVKHSAVPEVTIITHSHGGNVALNLASCLEDESPISIDRLILLACPVQQETAAFCDAPCFKSIHALYSYADKIQVLDPQGLHAIGQGIKESWAAGSLSPLIESAKESGKIPLFSERHFSSKKVNHRVINWKEKAPWSEADLATFGPLAATVKKWAEWDTKPRGLLHVEFILPSFVSHLPGIISLPAIQPGAQSSQDNEIAL